MMDIARNNIETVIKYKGHLNSPEEEISALDKYNITEEIISWDRNKMK